MKFDIWNVQGFDRTAASQLFKSGINPLIAVILASRGYKSIDDANNLLNNSICSLNDPLLLKDMDRAVSRINNALANNEHISIYGDYDVDGMTSSALLAEFFKHRNANFEIYIPSRMDEGYGLNRGALEELHSRGVSLVVTVDCGITAIEETEYARQLGLDIVITDHHECKSKLPNAYAVINPKRPDCMYPFKALAGVGVAFKLVCALSPDETAETLLTRYGDLVAVGTIADVMPVTDENRVLIKHGINILNNGTARAGLKKLISKSCCQQPRINSSAIGYAIAPRLNAAGRMGKTKLSVELLLTTDDAQAEQMSDALCMLNEKRREVESEIYSEALQMLEPGTGPIVLSKKDWHQGVMGIVAARLAEREARPAVLISIGDDGVGRGSCRSAGSFPLYSALRDSADLLLVYGGHEMAAGLSIPQQNITKLQHRLLLYYNKLIPISEKPAITIDFEVTKPELLEPCNVLALDSLEPFGNSHRPPCLCIMGAKLVLISSVGAGKHSRLKIEKSGKQLDCIFFSAPVESLGVCEGMIVDIVFEPQINEFRGRSCVQLHIFDIRKHLG